MQMAFSDHGFEDYCEDFTTTSRASPSRGVPSTKAYPKPGLVVSGSLECCIQDPGKEVRARRQQSNREEGFRGSRLAGILILWEKNAQYLRKH